MIIVICLSIMILSIIALYNVIIEIKVLKLKMEIKTALKKAGYSKGKVKGHYLTVAYEKERRMKIMKGA